ncbi:D-alanyl-D-alanine carboxypeptidase family protein [Patescibacteria group bacterium]
MEDIKNIKAEKERNNSKNIGLVLFIFILFGFVFVFGKKLFTRFIGRAIVIQKDLAEERYYSTYLTSEDIFSDWEPHKSEKAGNGPEIVGESGVLVDISSGEIIFEKNAYEQRPVASLVKIMTAVVALEHKNLDEEIIISKEAAEVGENVMGVSEGEVYTLEELLYGLMLNSGNDAAYAIAEGVAGDLDTFKKWMNLKAKELNLHDSYFGCPSGLHDGTYSTAVDLVKLSRYAMKNETFREIVNTYELEFPYSEKHNYIYLWNQTNLLTTYPGVGGIKTGYTEEAGLCLVTYAENEGKELTGVVLNSFDRKGDMILMLDFGFQFLGVSIEHQLLDY